MSRWFRGFYEEMLRAGDMFAAAGQQGVPIPDRQGGNPRHGRRTDGVRRNLHHHRAKGERPAHPREMTE